MLGERRRRKNRRFRSARWPNTSPGSGDPSGSFAGMPAFSSSRRPAPSDQDRLAVAVLVLARTARTCRSAARRSTPASPSGTTTASKSTGASSSRSRCPRRSDRRSTRLAPAPARARCSAAPPPRPPAVAPIARSAVRVARRRRRGSRPAACGCLPSPGRANSDSAGDASTSGVTCPGQCLRHRRRAAAHAQPRRHALGQLGARR